MLSFFRRQLSRLRIGERWWLRTAAWGLAGLAAGWVVSFFLPVRYTSEASLAPRARRGCLRTSCRTIMWTPTIC